MVTNMVLELITAGECLECELNSALHLHDLLEQLEDVSLSATYDFNTFQHLYTWLRIRLALHGNVGALPLRVNTPCQTAGESKDGASYNWFRVTRAVMRAMPDIRTGIVPVYAFDSIGI